MLLNRYGHQDCRQMGHMVLVFSRLLQHNIKKSGVFDDPKNRRGVSLWP